MPDIFGLVTERAWERLEVLGGISDHPPGLTRSFLSPANKSAAARVMGWMAEAGLAVSHDALGNICGRHDCPGSGCPPLLIGSHLDTVIDAGKYDGALGILVALAALEVLFATDSPPSVPVRILGFSDEEGVRFQATYLGSRACSGQMDASTLAVRDRSGRTLEEVIATEGWHEGAEEIRLGPGGAYLEIHIEQGRVLEQSGHALGVVSSICGQTRARVTLHGRTEHAGTTPMSLRQDALAGAAACVLAIESLAQSRPPTVATVGKLDVSPGAGNAIPGEVSFTLDLRHPGDAARQSAEAAIRSICHDIAAKRALGFDWEVVQTTAAVACDPPLAALLDSAAGNDVVPRIPSGAGHDAAMMSRIMPVGMFFVRCREGRSHHPDEAITREDLGAAIAATARFVKLWENDHG